MMITKKKWKISRENDNKILKAEHIWTQEDCYLISAAPELYEACKNALKYIIEGNTDSGLFGELEDAIAKAEGK